MKVPGRVDVSGRKEEGLEGGENMTCSIHMSRGRTCKAEGEGQAAV